MAAYMIAEITVTDPVPYDEYRKRVPVTLEPYGGRFLVRGGASESYEGEWHPGRIVVIEFPSVEQARAWHQSPAYQEILPLRVRNAESRMIVVEGV